MGEHSAPLIAGGGPVGLAAGLFLCEQNIETRIVERKRERLPYSKAFGVNPRTLELLESSGVTAQLLADGRKLTALNVWRKNRRVLRLDLSSLPHRYPFMLVHSQAATEELLEQALLDRGIPLERGTTVSQVEATGRGNVVQLTLADGTTESIEPPEVLGADGASSTVRESLGIGFPGSTWPEPWQLYDLELEHFPLDDGEAHSFLNDSGVLFMLRMEGPWWRVAGNCPDLLSHLPAGSRPGRIAWESEFHISHRLAARLRQGHVCLAGDAAHIHSPMGARGMNLGIEDAYVYVQLLAENRLEDYGRIRHPQIRQVIRRIERITSILRGRSLPAKAARILAPLAGTVAPLLASQIRRFVLGEDHPVRLR